MSRIGHGIVSAFASAGALAFSLHHFRPLAMGAVFSLLSLSMVGSPSIGRSWARSLPFRNPVKVYDPPKITFPSLETSIEKRGSVQMHPGSVEAEAIKICNRWSGCLPSSIYWLPMTKKQFLVLSSIPRQVSPLPSFS